MACPDVPRNFPYVTGLTVTLVSSSTAAGDWRPEFFLCLYGRFRTSTATAWSNPVLVKEHILGSGLYQPWLFKSLDAQIFFSVIGNRTLGLFLARRILYHCAIVARSNHTINESLNKSICHLSHNVIRWAVTFLCRKSANAVSMKGVKDSFSDGGISWLIHVTPNPFYLVFFSKVTSRVRDWCFNYCSLFSAFSDLLEWPVIAQTFAGI